MRPVAEYFNERYFSVNATTIENGHKIISDFSINLLVVYRESLNLIGYITRRLSADSLQL